MKKCKICGEKALTLGCHIKKHGISEREYFDKFLKKEKDGICKTCGGQTLYAKWKYNDYCSLECRPISRKYNTDISKLMNPTTPEAAYILGMFWADGYLVNGKKGKNGHGIALGLIEDDFLDIKNLFKILNEFKYSSRYRKNRVKKIGEINIGSKILYNFLFKNGYQNKSECSPSQILGIIPEELKHYWWRGYFDGDGCFYFGGEKLCRQMAFTGSFEQDWSEHEKLLNNLKLKYKIRKATTKQKKVDGSFCRYSQLRITDKHDVEKFGIYIYSGKLFGFKRKIDKFNKMISDYSSIRIG